MTFTNNSADDVFLTKIQARGTAVATKNPCTVRSIDTASQTEYGERKYVAQTKFIPTTSEAQDWCDYQASIYGSPIEILTMNIPANETSVKQALSRDISDRITVTATNDTNLGINTDFFIESEAHNVTLGGTEHTVQHNSLQLLADTLSSGFLANQSSVLIQSQHSRSNNGLVNSKILDEYTSDSSNA